MEEQVTIFLLTIGQLRYSLTQKALGDTYCFVLLYL